MIKYQVNLNYRFDVSYSSDQWLQLIKTLVDEMGFDDSAAFDMAMELQNHERTSRELTISEFETIMDDQLWPPLHQLILSNQWIKDMNVKVHLVKRQNHCTVTIQCDLDDAERRELIREKVDQLAALQMQSFTSADLNIQEMEALFGSMLLNDLVAQKTKQYFLRGDWQNCFREAEELIITQLLAKVQIDHKHYEEVITLLTKETPCLLLPDLSGDRLRAELGGLSHLIVGNLTLMQPMINRNPDDHIEPAHVLKYLVLTSIIIDRLENTIPNPAYHAGSKGTRTSGRLSAQPKTTKTTKKRKKVMKAAASQGKGKTKKSTTKKSLKKKSLKKKVTKRTTKKRT